MGGLAGAFVALRAGIPGVSGASSGPYWFGFVVVDVPGLVEPVEYAGGLLDAHSVGQRVGDVADADSRLGADHVADPFL